MATYGAALKAIYGSSAGSVRLRLVPVTFDFPGDNGAPQPARTIYVHGTNMAARLRNVNRDINLWCEQHPGTGYTLHSLGCFNWRLIFGTLFLSMHSGAIAIDINPAQNPQKWGALVTDMPRWFVEAFKRWGFIWGGDWRHKDAMHFELAVHTEPDDPIEAPPVNEYQANHNFALRVGPSLTAKAIHPVARRERMTFLGINGSGDGKWAQVAHDGRVGWVMRTAIAKVA